MKGFFCKKCVRDYYLADFEKKAGGYCRDWFWYSGGMDLLHQGEKAILDFWAAARVAPCGQMMQCNGTQIQSARSKPWLFEILLYRKVH